MRATDAIRRAFPLLAVEGQDRDLEALRVAVEGDLADAIRHRRGDRDVDVTGKVEARGSGVVEMAGPGFGPARIVFALQPGGAVAVALAAPGGLPADLEPVAGPLRSAAPELGAGDDVGRVALGDTVALVSYGAGALPDEHRWWGDVGGLLMLADLLGASIRPG